MRPSFFLWFWVLLIPHPASSASLPNAAPKISTNAETVSFFSDLTAGQLFEYGISSDTDPTPFENYRPKDFDLFWKNTRKELAGMPPDIHLIPAPSQSNDKVRCFKADYLSLHRIRIHAWYCRPTTGGPFPGILINPWYGESSIDPPAGVAARGFAVLWYQARGYEVDQSSYPVDNSWYILSGIEKPDTYIYREIVSHAIRGIDFLARQPEVDPKKIATAGASQGGGLTLILAGMDPRISLAAADFPFLSDFLDSIPNATSPYADIRKYITENSTKRSAILKTLSYFDTLNFVGRVGLPILIQTGLRDKTCPAQGIARAYQLIPSKSKELKIFPTASHIDHNSERWNSMMDFLTDHLLH